MTPRSFGPLLRLLLTLALFAAGCGSPLPDEDLDPVEDLAAEGKDDSVLAKVVQKGAIDFGQEVAAAFDTSKIHGYLFRGAKGAPVSVGLTGNAAQKTDTVVMLYGPRSGTGWSGSPIARDDDGGGSRFSRISGFALPSEGEYLIVATCKNWTFKGRLYRLSLSCGAASCAPSQKRIDIEVDFIGYQRFEAGTIKIVEDYFASIGYQLTIVEDEELPPLDGPVEYGTGSKMLKSYYLTHFGHRGQQGWHYMLMADKVGSMNQGWGMMGGDLFIIAADPRDSNPSHRKEAQAWILMHELGHNLSLRHEGVEPEKSAGTHTAETCASYGFQRRPVPLNKYSPACIANLRLDSLPYVK